MVASIGEVTILYLIANSIKIDCDYCIFTGNGVPLNTCFTQLDSESQYRSYTFTCNSELNIDGITQLDYTNPSCSGVASRTQILYNIVENSCSTIDKITCSSDQSVIVKTLQTNNNHLFQKQNGFIINKCVGSQSPNTNTNFSKYIQCTNSSITEWLFTDIACTQLQTVNKYVIDDSYQFNNVVIQSINNCPICSYSVNYNTITPPNQNNMNNAGINYIIINDGTYSYPQPMDICNKFIINGNIRSYQYSCVGGEIYKFIWYNSECNNIYDDNIILSNTDYLDYNCINFANMLTHREKIQPSFVQLIRYKNVPSNVCAPNMANWTYVSYITNYCIAQNEYIWIIIEAQKLFLTIHLYEDSNCNYEISQCMKLWKTDNCNMINNNYYDNITSYFGEIRIPVYSMQIQPVTTTKEPHLLSIDTTIHTNYVRRHGNLFPEAIQICNEYIEFGAKHSYKYICIEDSTTNIRRFKKRKWKHKTYCDNEGDDWDEEDDINDWEDGICLFQQIAVTMCKINCFIDIDRWEQKTVILENCIQINNNQNSIYIQCFKDQNYTITYYYFNNDCTNFDHKEYWYGKQCESRYSKYLIQCYPYPNGMYTTKSPASYYTYKPTMNPIPTMHPTNKPTLMPIPTLSPIPTWRPTPRPTPKPTSMPIPTLIPIPTIRPTPKPTSNPIPTYRPTPRPTLKPTGLPTMFTFKPTITPTKSPITNFPTTNSPTPVSPTTFIPTASPFFPTFIPTTNPTDSPTPIFMTNAPTTQIPTPIPMTSLPPGTPTISPSISPTFPPGTPTISPTFPPTFPPGTTTFPPTTLPPGTPTISPSISPTTLPPGTPTISPTFPPTLPPGTPTFPPTTLAPGTPTISPSISPTTQTPTISPSISPTTQTPTISPSIAPTTETPTTLQPTPQPTNFPTTDPTIIPSTNPTITPTINPTQIPTINPTPNPTFNPSLSPTILTSPPTSNPTPNPTTHFPTAINETLSPSINPTISPTVSPTVDPTDFPSENPTINPTQSPTENPTINPTQSPTENPTEIPTALPTQDPVTTFPPGTPTFPTVSPEETTFVPTTESPTTNPTPIPIETTFVPTPEEPTTSPTRETTFVPTTENPTTDPTSAPLIGSPQRRCSVEMYVTYNQTNASYWMQFQEKYIQFMQRAIILTYENLTGHSMNYSEDVWENRPWTMAGIVNYETCFIFEEKVTQRPDCPTFSNPLTPEDAEFVAVVWFCVLADTNVNDFYEYIDTVSGFKNFSDIVDFYINPILNENTPCCNTFRRRRLLQIFYSHVTISVTVIDPNNLPLENRNPLGYQGIFINSPAVTGDITIILMIIAGLMSICALICWCCHRENCYYKNNEEQFARFQSELEMEMDMEQQDDEKREEEMMVPLKKS